MLVVPSKQAIVIKAANPAHVLACIPHAKQFNHKGNDLIYVPHEVEATQILRNFGVQVPSPIQYYYDFPFPGGRRPFEHQKLTCDFLTMHRRCVVLNQPRCVDKDTEFLTPSGWKKISTYDGELVGQYNQSTRQVEFVTPEAYHVTPCGEMIHFVTDSIDEMVSFGHRMLLRNPWTGKESVMPAIELYGMLVNNTYSHNTHAVPVTFSPPDTEGLPLTKEEIRLMVAVIADGYFPPNSTNRVVVRLKKLRKKERLRELLLAANVEWKEREQNTATAQGYTVFSFTAPRKEKNFSAWWACSMEQLIVVTDEVLFWDGNVTTGRKRFSSYVKSSADFVQYAFVSCGYSTALRENRRTRRGVEEVEYVVSVHKSGSELMTYGRKTRPTKSKIVPTEDGKMYCFTVPSSFLVFRRNGHVFVSGNTGKTLSCIWAADYLMRLGLIRRVLVIAPLSTLDYTWGQSLFEAVPHRRYAILHGEKKKRLRLMNEGAEFLVVNHDGFRVVEKELPEDIDLVVYDEAAVLRNPGTSRFKLFSKFIFSRPDTRLWLLTGTPTPNEPTDAWALCKLMGVAIPRHTAFREMVMQKVGMWKWTPRPESAELVSTYLRPSILFKRDDCFDLPDIGYDTRHCEMSPEQAKMYRDLLKKLAAEASGHSVTAVNEAAKIQKILQVLLGVVYTDASGSATVDCESRTAVIEEVIEECDEKVLVFVPFTGALEAITAHLAKKYAVEMVNGSVSAAKRNEVFKAFTTPDGPRVIVADARTMSHGLDLSSATTIIWAGPTNSNEVYEQACARILGPKQKHKASIVHIVSTRIERDIFDRLKNKQKLQGLLLDLLQQQ